MIEMSCATAGVVLVSPEFVRKKHCMAELNILLRRWRAGEVHLLPVLYGGLTVEDLSNMRQLYESQEWCVREKEIPDSWILDAWAADVDALTGIAVIRRDEVTPPSMSWLCVESELVGAMLYPCQRIS